MRREIAMTALIAAVTLGGCAHMSTTEQRMLSGAGIGAVGGAAVGAATGGSVGAGAAIGAGAGALGGYLYDRSRSGR